MFLDLVVQVMKAVSGKFHPLFQWFYFDSAESLPPIEDLTHEACAAQARTSDRMLRGLSADRCACILCKRMR